MKVEDRSDWQVGDPCPRCGSEATYLSGPLGWRREGKPWRLAVPPGARFEFFMRCWDCGLRVRRRGTPARDLRPCRQRHAEPGAAPDTGRL